VLVGVSHFEHAKSFLTNKVMVNIGVFVTLAIGEGRRCSATIPFFQHVIVRKGGRRA
jgi:hypothetical protein